MTVSPLALGRKLNWRPSVGLHHLKKYRHLEIAPRKRLLSGNVDLRSQQSPVWDQGQTGSCSGFSTKSHLEHLQIKELLAKAPATAANPLEWVTDQLVPISAFFPYWNARAVEGTSHTDAGASSLLDLFTQANVKGVCSDKTWPATAQNLLTCPPSLAYGEAWHHKLPFFYSVDQTLEEMCRCLDNGFGFSFGIVVYDSFMSDSAAGTGIIPFPSPYENVQGGHALYCVGYVYTGGQLYFVFKNSWSSQWGDNGYGYLPAEYMLSPQLASDQLTGRLVAMQTMRPQPLPKAA